MIGKVVNSSYEIEEKLGAGGMGVVYKALQYSLQRPVAIKFITENPLHNRVMLTRFKREALACARISHPYIVRMIDFNEWENIYYLVMEYAPHGSLEEILQRQNMLEEHEALLLLLQSVSALKAAHQCGIVHRDLKPSNMLLSQKNHIKLTDFGIAHLDDMTQLTKTGSVLGTPQYMSPEQCMGKEVDERTDIYSLGVVFYQVFTGKPPFQADNPSLLIQKHVYARPRPLREYNVRISPPIEEIILKCLAKSPVERFKSAEDLEMVIFNYMRTRKAYVSG